MYAYLRDHVLYNNIVAAILFVLVLWLLYSVRFVLVVVFFAFIFAVGFLPLVRYAQSRGARKIAAVLLPYVLLASALIVAVIPLVPLLSGQLKNLFSSFPAYVKNIGTVLDDYFGTLAISDSVASSFSSIVEYVSRNIVSATAGAFSITVSVFAIMVISFYLLLDYDRIRQGIISVVPKKYEREALRYASQLELVLGHWLRAQFLASVIVGVLTWLLLLVFGVQFSAALGLIAGITEFVPYVGPIIAASVAIAVASGESVGAVITVACIFLFVQFVEGYVIVPQVMKRAVSLNPIVVIVGVFAGSALMGIVGALIAVPIIAAFDTTLRHVARVWKNGS